MYMAEVYFGFYVYEVELILHFAQTQALYTWNFHPFAVFALLSDKCFCVNFLLLPSPVVYDSSVSSPHMKLWPVLQPFR